MKRILLAITAILITSSQLSAGVTVVGGLSRIQTAQAGQEYRGEIELHNNGDAPRELKVYLRDYSFQADGSNSYGDPGSLKRSNAPWITFSPQRITVPPQSRSRINYTVVVPPEPVSGTFWSMLMLELIPTSSPEAGGQHKRIHMGVTQVTRYGLQLITHIGQSGSRSLQFSEPQIVMHEQQRTLQIDVANDGERMLRPNLWAELFSMGGSPAGKIEGGDFRIYPGTSARYRLNIEGLPAGDYRALIVADGGGDDIFGARYTLKVGD